MWPVYARRAFVGLDLHPGRLQRREREHLVHQCVPFATPLTSADSIRFVQIEASAHEKSRAASPPCVYVADVFGCQSHPMDAPETAHPAHGRVTRDLFRVRCADTKNMRT